MKLPKWLKRKKRITVDEMIDEALKDAVYLEEVDDTWAVVIHQIRISKN